MKLSSSRVVAFAMVLAVAACDHAGVPPPAASWNPAPPPSSWQPVPAGRVELPPEVMSALAALAADPEAQRFLLLQYLIESGLVSPTEAMPRRAANLGALLPYSAPPPAAGLDRPIPAEEMVGRLNDLANDVTNSSGGRAAERRFLLDSLLPITSRAKAPPVRTDAAALAAGRVRVDGLTVGGLVSSDEHDRELEAIAQAEEVQANLPPPPPPAPPPKPKVKVKKKAHHAPGAEGEPHPGDVPGGAIAGTGNGPMAVHLLSMASPTMVDKATETLKRDYPELGSLEFKAVKTEIPDLGTTYRLLAGPLSAADAQKMCQTLRAKSQSCAVTRF
jgi:hypothetical protein